MGQLLMKEQKKWKASSFRFTRNAIEKFKTKNE